jgi:hypothetical protein
MKPERRRAGQIRGGRRVTNLSPEELALAAALAAALIVALVAWLRR